MRPRAEGVETAGRALYVVFDTKGAGRVVGVFDSARLATRVRAIDPHYYQIHRSDVNHIRHDAIEWLTGPEQRRAMHELIAAEDLEEDL